MSDKAAHIDPLTIQIGIINLLNDNLCSSEHEANTYVRGVLSHRMGNEIGLFASELVSKIATIYQHYENLDLTN